jgi:hypothetical protein
VPNSFVNETKENTYRTLRGKVREFSGQRLAFRKRRGAVLYAVRLALYARIILRMMRFLCFDFMFLVKEYTRTDVLPSV